MSDSEKVKQQILGTINAYKETYGQVLVQSGIIKREGKWFNIITKIVPLHRNDALDPRSLRKWDYGNFAIIESLI
jgi:hypothetical protein